MAYLTGELLKRELDNPDLGQEHLIEELIYKDTSTMFTALPEAGKSVVSINALASASNGEKVFGFLRCPKPLRMAYLQFEGSRDEQMGRLKAISEVTSINFKNISWHEPTLLAERPETWQELNKELEEVSPIDLIFIDPLYRVTIQGLKTELGAIATIKWMDTLRKRHHASLWANHHAVKEQYDDNGRKIEKDDPFYGSQWLKAYFDNAYLLKRETPTLTSLTCKKSRASNILQKFYLDFDISTFTVKANLEKTPLTARIRIREYLLKTARGEKLITHKICMDTKTSRRQVLRLRSDGDFNDLVEYFSQDGIETEWIRK